MKEGLLKLVDDAAAAEGWSHQRWRVVGISECGSTVGAPDCATSKPSRSRPMRVEKLRRTSGSTDGRAITGGEIL